MLCFAPSPFRTQSSLQLKRIAGIWLVLPQLPKLPGSMAQAEVTAAKLRKVTAKQSGTATPLATGARLEANSGIH